jgi:hypothetical protein
MPPVHDLRSARADRPLYEDLYRRTAEVAEPVIEEAVTRVTAESVDQLLAQELDGLQSFLVGHSLEGELMSDAEVGAGLREFLKAGLERDRDVAATTHRIAEEFSLVFWDYLLKRMADGAPTSPRSVRRSELSLAVDGETADQWKELDDLLVPFALSRSDAASIFVTVLRQLSDAAHADVIRLPLGLEIDRAMLERALANQPEPGQGVTGVVRDLFDGLSRALRG